MELEVWAAGSESDSLWCAITNSYESNFWAAELN